MTTSSLYIQPIQPHLHDIPELPTTITLPDGQEYSVAGELWFLPQGPGLPAVRLDWTLLNGVMIAGTSTPMMSMRAVRLAKFYFLERMGSVRNPLKPLSGKQYLRAMLHFARSLATHSEWLPIDRSFEWGDLTDDMFDVWLMDEYRTKRKGHSAALIRLFYSWGADPDQGHPDFSAALASVLSTRRLRNHATGELVASHDKRRGAFTREELNLIFVACATGAGTDQERAIAWTLLETAIRPKQIYQLTNRDLEISDGTAKDDNSVGTFTQAIYRLRVSKLKQRSYKIEYHFLPLSEECAKLLLSLRKPRSGPTGRLFWWLPSSYDVHFIQKLKSFSVSADLRSPRLPIENPLPGGPFHELMHITPRRFRYGVATDRIARGDSPDDVAEMLGHKGTRWVHAYAETSPGIADVFQRATDYAIAPLIALMEGRTRASDATLLADIIPPAPDKLSARCDEPVVVRDTGQLHNYSQKHNRPTRASFRIASWKDTSEARIEELIASARRKFALIYPHQDFNAQLWDVFHLRERTNVNSLTNFGFTTLASTNENRNRLSPYPEDALPAYFADVIKSWLVISNDVTLGFNENRLNAARHFWDFLSTRGTGEGASFVWGALSEEDFLAFEQFIMTHKTSRGKPYSPSTILQQIYHIQSLVDFLASHGICRHIEYIPQTPSPRANATRLLGAKKLAAERKLPAPGVLETLSGLYHRLTTAPEGEVSDWMQIVISALAILMLTGLRVGELVTLPFDCEVESGLPEGRSGDSYPRRYGIRYWLEKTRMKTMRIRWISPTAESIVRTSIARIKRLTAAAREQARVLEAAPTKVTLPPEIASRTIIGRPELFALLGLRSKNPINTDPHKLLPQYGRGRKSYYYVKDLEAYLLSRRVAHLYTIKHNDGTYQMLSESLFVIFARQSRCWMDDPCRLLVEPVLAQTIRAYVHARTNLFRTYGETEWQKGLSANTHCFRHWLIHIAYKGGMETHLIVRYFAKLHDERVEEYLHFSTGESDAYAPEALKEERFYVPV